MDVNERLRKAAQAGSESELKSLLQEPGCDALSKANNGSTALMWAARFGREGCVRLLLPSSDALAKDEDGWTALMWAAWSGHEGCVRTLLPVSAPLSKNEEGFTARELARDGGHESLAQFIEAYALALRELASIGKAARPGVPREHAALRV